MTYMECFLVLCALGAIPGFLFGFVYPAAMVIWYKLAGSGLSVKEILKQI